MAGGIMEFHVVDQLVQLLWSARSEMLLFFIAFLLHHFLFGNVFPKSKGKKDDKAPTTRSLGAAASVFPPNQVDQGPTHFRDHDDALSCGRAAFQRGDHRMVLRCWNHLKRSDDIPAVHLAQIVESMQRFKKDTNSILQELRVYLKRAAPDRGGIIFINEVLEPLAKSLDAELVMGIFTSLQAAGFFPNQKTYEVVVSMHFTTRTFSEVAVLANEMLANGIQASGKTQMVLLKSALHTGNFQDAMALHRQVLKNASLEVPTASAAPKHMAMQLVELAIREKRVDLIVEELEKFQDMPLTTEMLNALLVECNRIRATDLSVRMENLAKVRITERNGRTYDLLVRASGSNKDKIAALLDEMAEQGLDCAGDVTTAVLAACGSDGEGVALADKLHKHFKKDQSSQIPALLALARFYAENDKAEKACEIFDQHLTAHADLGGGSAPQRRRALLDARTERCLVNAALQRGRGDIVTALLEPTPADTAKHISMVRGCAQKGDLEGALGIFRALENSGAELTHSLYNTVLDACVECNSLDKAEDMMKRMQEKGMTDAVSFNTILKAQLKRENYAKARGLMEAMHQSGHTPNEVTYNELINSLIQSEKPAQRAKVWEILHEMKAANVNPNRITCSILLRSLKASSSDHDIARTMELTDAMAEPMDEVLLSSIVEACVRIGKPALLSAKLHQLLGSGEFVVSGVHTFGSLIKAYGRSKDMMGAWRCWKEMRSQHVRPTSITIGCMVEAVVSNGDVDGGYELICQLLEDDHCRDQVNSIIFGSVLKGYGRSHRFDRMLAVFKEMTAYGIEPSVATYNAVIDACARNCRMNLAPELAEDMKRRGLTPNLITYSTLIKGFCQKGDVPAALSSLEDMHKDKTLKPDEIVYNTLLEGCAKSCLVVEAERILVDMQEAGVRPSNYTLSVMVKILGQARKVGRAYELVEQISTKYRFKPNSDVQNALLQACVTSKNVPKGVSVFERMVRERCPVDPRVCQSLIRGALAVNQEDAVKILRASLGIPGSGFTGASGDRVCASSGLDDAFVNEVLSALAERGGEYLAKPLLADLSKASRRIRVDSALERRLSRKSAK